MIPQGRYSAGVPVFVLFALDQRVSGLDPALLTTLRAEFDKAAGGSFLARSCAEQLQILTDFDAAAYAGPADAGSPAHAWRRTASRKSWGSCLTWVARSSRSDLGRPGTSIHEMGGACMGKDPRTSVTGAFNQVHDAPNVFVTDRSAMSSSGDRNPSLTYMALTARASAHAVDRLKQGTL